MGCPHVITLDFRVLFRAESVGEALSIVLERFPKLPKAIFYDVACKIDKNAMRRVRPILGQQGVRCILDRPHSITHSCSPVYMPDQSLGTTAGVATQAAEVSHSISVGNRTSLAYMAPATYMIHRMFQVAFMNTRKLYRLDTDNPRAENDHIALAGFFHDRLSRMCQLGAACSCDTSGATVAAHNEVPGPETHERRDAAIPTASGSTELHNGARVDGSRVGQQEPLDQHSEQHKDRSGNEDAWQHGDVTQGDGEMEYRRSSTDGSAPSIAGAGAVSEEVVAADGNDARPRLPALPPSRDDHLIRSLMVDSDDEACVPAGASSSEKVSVVRPGSIPAVTAACVRDLKASRVFSPDNSPPPNALVVFVASLAAGREYGELVRPLNKAGVKLNVSDFCRLHGSGWMNDEIMNSYIALINCRDRDIRKARAAGSSCLNGMQVLSSTRRTFCFNTFLFSRLWSVRMGYDYEGCKRWGVKLGLRLDDVDIIIVPINLKSIHWVLVVIDIEKRTFLFCDSFLSSDPINAVCTTRR